MKSSLPLSRDGQVKLGVLALGLALVGMTIFSLQFFMERLLERDALRNGMRWAENIETGFADLDRVFLGDVDPSTAMDILERMSAVGQIYRYEFIGADGKIALATGSYHPPQGDIPAQHHAHSHDPVEQPDPVRPKGHEAEPAHAHDHAGHASPPAGHHGEDSAEAGHGTETHAAHGHSDHGSHAAAGHHGSGDTGNHAAAHHGHGTDAHQGHHDTYGSDHGASHDNHTEAATGHHGSSAEAPAGATHAHAGHDGHAHTIDLKIGDGVTQPNHFAAIGHPVSKNGVHIGTIRVFLDQTETHHLFQETMLSLLAILVGGSILGFGIPSYFYLRGRAAAEQANAKVRFLAHHDAMTQLVNRNKFVESVDTLLAAENGGSSNHALHFIDVDNFKAINDTFGHDAGDELLRQISDQLRVVIPTNNIVARFGGDEFAVLQKDVLCGEEIEAFAEQLQSVFSSSHRVNDHNIATSASIGTAVSGRHGATCDALMKCADIALYTVKARGRAGHLVFEPDMKRKLDQRIEMEAAIRLACEQDGFEVYFQPLFASNSSRLSGFEALVRMRGKDETLISPSDFIPVAEEMGLMEEIGQCVLRKAACLAATWPDHLILAVNLSTKQFESGKLVDIVRDALDESGLKADRLELEITEGLIIRNTDWNLDQLHALKELGVSIVMDDFGTGYSSLGYLWRFPFDKIKIDQSFLRGFESNESKVRTIIQTIIALGHSLNMVVTAEGVESGDQLAMLREMECDLLQGFLLGKPCSVEDIAPLLLADFRQQSGSAQITSAERKSA